MTTIYTRGALFLAALIYMQSGPLLVTGLHQRRPSGLRPWQMYHGVGHDECKLSVFAIEGDSVTPVPWSTLLPKEPGDKTRSIVKHADGVRLAKRLCDSFPPRVGLSAVTTCATGRQWKPPSDTLHEDICPRRRSRVSE